MKILRGFFFSPFLFLCQIRNFIFMTFSDFSKEGAFLSRKTMKILFFFGTKKSSKTLLAVRCKAIPSHKINYLLNLQKDLFNIF